MGEALYSDVVGAGKLNRPCRIYAPVGGHEDLLAYLVRRLLENGANTSFVNRIADEDQPIDEIIRDPVEAAEIEHESPGGRPKALPAPGAIFGARRNSLGLALSEPSVRDTLYDGMTEALKMPLMAAPLIDAKIGDLNAQQEVVA